MPSSGRAEMVEVMMTARLPSFRSNEANYKGAIQFRKGQEAPCALSGALDAGHDATKGELPGCSHHRLSSLWRMLAPSGTTASLLRGL